MITYDIDAEARGKLRVFKQRLAKQAAALEARFPQLSKHAAAMSYRGSAKGRTRALQAICRLLGPAAHLENAQLHGREPLALWVYLRPQEPGPDRPGGGVSADFLAVGCLPKGGAIIGQALTGLWSLDISDHALGRLLQRARHLNDPEPILLAAHRAMLRVSMLDLLNALRNPTHAVDSRQSFLLPAGPGVFICAPARRDDDGLYVRQPTWLNEDQLHENQLPIATVAKTTEESLGFYLLPRILREANARVLQ